MLAKRMEGLHPYVPGEQPGDRPYIKLNANENPYPPAPDVPRTVARFVMQTPRKLALYPDPDSEELRTALAGLLNETGGVLSRTRVENRNGIPHCSPDMRDRIPFSVTPDMIYCGNGSDEVLSFIFYACFDSDRPVVLPEYTYSFYPVYAGFYGIPLDPVPLRSDWSLDTGKMLDDAASYDSAVIFANPNAPTGRSLAREEIRSLLERAPEDRVFVVDEAYVDFGGESCIPLLAEFDNLIIVRTFSKSMCGAGMRLGYLVAAPELVQAVTTVKNSLNHFPVDAVSQAGGIAACSSAAYYAGCAAKIAAERNRFSDFLSARGWYVIPSSTNFVFVKKDGLDGLEAYQKIRENGILVRRFATPGIENFLRITIGTPEQMEMLGSVMERL